MYYCKPCNKLNTLTMSSHSNLSFFLEINSTMSCKMGSTINFILLLAMLATNLLSLYHLSTTTNLFFFHPNPNPNPKVPTHLLHQLHTIRATITRLTRLHTSPRATTSPPLSPVPSSCSHHPLMLHNYMNYTPYTLCPPDLHLAESLILRGCHPLPRRRCFSPTPPTNHSSSNHELKSDFMVYKSSLDLTIPQLFDIAKKSGVVLRLGVDIGGGYGDFAVKMRNRNVTILSTTMNLGVPYNEVNAMRGVVAIHAPLQQRLPVDDGVVDLVRCGHAVNRWIPKVMLEFLLYDVDRVLKGGGYLWVDHFFSKGVDLEKVYKPLLFKLGYKIVKWATGSKKDGKGGKNKNEEVYLTALLQKPQSR